jgi:hypothetical protein
VACSKWRAGLISKQAGHRSRGRESESPSLTPRDWGGCGAGCGGFVLSFWRLFLIGLGLVVSIGSGDAVVAIDEGGCGSGVSS